MERNSIEQAASHLRVALLQATPSDDQIILGHVRDALELLERVQMPSARIEFHVGRETAMRESRI